MQIAANALSLSVFYLSFSLGLTMIFGVMRVVNYTHGEIFMIGGYVLLACVTLLHGHLHGYLVFTIAILAAAAVGGLLGLLINVGLAQRLRKQPFSLFMATLGLSYVLQVVVIESFGPVGRSIPPMIPGIINQAGIIMPLQRAVVLVVTLALVIGIWLFLTYTKPGVAMRAVAQNETGAVLQGMNLRKIGLLTFIMASALAGISGAMMGSLLNVNPFMGGEAIWRAFIVVIVGGIGSLPGAVIAAALFGVLDSVLTGFGYGQYVALTDAVIMLLILSFFPSGLMGARS